MNPVRRLVFYLRYQSGSYDNGARDHDDEYGRPIAGVGKAEIETAHVAPGFQRQEPLKQLSLAASRTSTQKASAIRRWHFFRDLLGREFHLQLSAFRLGGD